MRTAFPISTSASSTVFIQTKHFFFSTFKKSELSELSQKSKLSEIILSGIHKMNENKMQEQVQVNAQNDINNNELNKLDLNSGNLHQLNKGKPKAQMFMDQLPKMPKDDLSQITLTSFNVLADIYSSHKRKDPTFPHHYLDWQVRLEKTRKFLDSTDSEIICLQEVEGGDKFEVNFKNYYEERGYQCVIQQNNHYVSNVIMFKKSMFALEIEESRSRTMFIGLRRRDPITGEPIFFQDSAIETDENSSSSSSTTTNSTKPVKKEKANAKKLPNREGMIFVASVHLEGHHSEFVKRLSQVKSLLTRIQSYISPTTPTDKVAIFVCGDFNCNHKSGVYKYLKDGEDRKSVV